MALALTPTSWQETTLRASDITTINKYTYGLSSWHSAHKVFRVSELLFRRLEAGYKGILHGALNHRILTTILAVLVLAGSLLLIPMVGTEMMPESDEGEVRLDAEMEVGTRLQLTDEKIQQVGRLIRDAVPEIKSMSSSAGGSHWRGTASHTGNMRISLVPQAQRWRSSEEIA